MKQSEYKDIAAPASNLGEVIVRMKCEEASGVDKMRAILSARMNQYSDIALTEEDGRRLRRAFHDIEMGSVTNLVMICSKSVCMYKDRCPLFTADKAPEGKECLHENYMLIHYLDQYTKSLEIDLDNMVEMILLNQLVEYEVLEYRCNNILSNAHQGLTWSRIIGLDKEGEIVEAEDVSYALTIKDNVQKKKIALLQEFTATRREKYKKQVALKESKEGPAKIMSSMKARIKDIKNKELNYTDVETALNADINLGVNSQSNLEDL